MVSNERRQSMKDFYVKNPLQLERFGFHRTQAGQLVYCFVHRNGYSTISLHVSPQTGHVVIQSPSKDVIALLCELYRQGILEIVDIDEKQSATIRMNLTPEEAELVHNFRNGKRNE